MLITGQKHDLSKLHIRNEKEIQALWNVGGKKIIFQCPKCGYNEAENTQSFYEKKELEKFDELKQIINGNKLLLNDQLRNWIEQDKPEKALKLIFRDIKLWEHISHQTEKSIHSNKWTGK